MCDIKTAIKLPKEWEVVGSINDYCTYMKDKLTKNEVDSFMHHISSSDGRIAYRWPGGDILFLPNLDKCAFWSRKMR